MSGGDALDRAVRALRETGETPAADVARTRMRVLETMRRGERRRRRTFWVLLPIAAVLAGGAALAKDNGVVRRVWISMAETMGIASPGAKSGPPVRRAHGLGARAPSSEASESADAPANGVPEAAPVEAEAHDAPNVGGVPAAENVTPVPASAPSVPNRRHQRAELADRADAPSRSNLPPETTEPEPLGAPAPNDGEAASLQLYKNAHRLHFVEQRYDAALAAWDEYLRSAPNGRLVVEARYNRAIALVRLGRRAEAETVLAPFARGEVGAGYRAREAQELLDALNASSR